MIYIAGGLRRRWRRFRINDKTGAVSNLVSAPYVAGNSPSSVVADPSGRFLYVANALDNTISLFSDQFEQRGADGGAAAHKLGADRRR